MKTVKNLINFGLLTDDHRITSFGSEISKYPIGYHYGKMLILSKDTEVFTKILIIIATESVRDPLIRDASGGSNSEINNVSTKEYRIRCKSDSIAMHNMYVDYHLAKDPYHFCEKSGFRYKVMRKYMIGI